jgi:hypothetical protein
MLHNHQFFLHKMLCIVSFLVHRVFIFYIKGMLKFECPDLIPEG